MDVWNLLTIKIKESRYHSVCVVCIYVCMYVLRVQTNSNTKPLQCHINVGYYHIYNQSA